MEVEIRAGGSETVVIKKKLQRSPFFFISSLTNSGLEKNGERFVSRSGIAGARRLRGQ